MNACSPSYKAKRIAASLAIVAGVAYPFIVYFGRPAISASALVGIAVAIVLARVFLAQSPEARRWRLPLLLIVPALLALAFFSPVLAVKAYPVAVSLAAAAVFGFSLLFPPALIERFARLSEPSLPPEGQAYCRTLTWVWTIWLLVNAFIAGVLGWSGWEQGWALWTGLVAYLVMGLLAGGEILVRKRLRAKVAGP